MNLSKKAEYGLRAMINLGIARACGHERVPAATLARADNLPLKFLEQILIQLREAGFVGTRRGKSGGYFISRPIEGIRMGDLIRLLQGPLAPISCASQSAYQRCSCPDETHCGLRMLMIDVRNAVTSILDRYSLSDVVEITLRKLRRDGIEHYFLSDRDPIPLKRDNNPADPAEGFLAELTRRP